ncbi:MAG: ATP-binding protein, partial [Bacteroidales bacterium]|nr:ATP-binding protein [Bacteroidales bacterium]
MEDINEKIVHYSRQLRLPGFRKNYQSLQEEMSGVKLAGFPQLKYLQELSLEDLPKDGRERLPALKSLDFIKNGQNIILAGNPGTGKSHVATGLGLEACKKDYTVYFVTVPQL